MGRTLFYHERFRPFAGLADLDDKALECFWGKLERRGYPALHFQRVRFAAWGRAGQVGEAVCQVHHARKTAARFQHRIMVIGHGFDDLLR